MTIEILTKLFIMILYVLFRVQQTKANSSSETKINSKMNLSSKIFHPFASRPGKEIIQQNNKNNKEN